MSRIRSSRHSHMWQLRIQWGGNPTQVFYAFDPRRTAIVFMGAKRGDDRSYDKRVPIADGLYHKYIEELREEGLL